MMSRHEDSLRSGSRIYMQVDPDALINKASFLLTKRHWHYEYEVKLCLSGSSYVNIDTQHILLREKQAIMIAPMQFHSIQENQGEHEIHFTFRFLPDEDMQARLRASGAEPYFLFPVTPQMETLCKTVLYNSNLPQREPYWEDELFAILKAVVCCVLRELKIKDVQQCESINNETPLRALQIRRYITRCIDEQREPKLQDITRMLNLSVRQTSRVIQSIYGTSFRRAVLGIRMDQATFLLRETDKPVIDIIHQIGYKEESEFYHKFYECYHLTPGLYRKKWKMENVQPDG